MNPTDPEQTPTLSAALIAFLVLNVALCVHLAIQIIAAGTLAIAQPLIQRQRDRGRTPNPWLIEAYTVASEVDHKLATMYNAADEVFMSFLRGGHWLYVLFAGPQFVELFRLLALLIVEIANLPGRWLYDWLYLYEDDSDYIDEYLDDDQWTQDE